MASKSVQIDSTPVFSSASFLAARSRCPRPHCGVILSKSLRGSSAMTRVKEPHKSRISASAQSHEMANALLLLNGPNHGQSVSEIGKAGMRGAAFGPLKEVQRWAPAAAKLPQAPQFRAYLPLRLTLSLGVLPSWHHLNTPATQSTFDDQALTTRAYSTLPSGV